MADIQTGTTFVDGNTYNAAAFNAAVNAATILPDFVSSKPTGVMPATADLLLSYQSGTGLVAPPISAVLNLQLKDQAANVASMRTLGSGATQAAQGSLVALLASSQTFTGTSNVFKHIDGVNGVTILVAAGAGVGATATLDARANDISGVITLTPAGTPTASTTQCTLTFGVAYPHSPHVILVPLNAAAIVDQATSGKAITWTGSTTTLILTSGTTPLTAATALTYGYVIFGS